MREYGVFIGRFQPFHTAHLETIRFALTKVKQLLVFVGSANQSKSIKNPWSWGERVDMISCCLTDDEFNRVVFLSAKDHLYNDNLWLAEIQDAVNDVTQGSKDVVLFGKNKDASSFYLKLFPQWDHIDSNITSTVSATKVRTLLFEQDKIGVKSLVPAATYDRLTEYMNTPEFDRLHNEYHHIIDYKSKWASSPFPPTFNTVDAIVICSGHVLVVRRKGSPGKGLIALPGGFLNVNERIVDGCVRELKEETGIRISQHDLKNKIVDEKVFDHPNRSLRGRTITHAFCIDLGKGELPVVKGMDDADKAWWMSLNEISDREYEFFEDHAHIIKYFISRN